MKPKKIVVFFSFIIVAFILLYYVRMYATYAQVCMTVQEVANDSRCLFIYSNRVFEKGTRTAPHQGNVCGTDVTAFIPSFHFMSAAQYLDPNYVGNICSVQPSATPTLTPSPTPLPPTAVPTTPASSCPASKPKGDANCDGVTTLADYIIWRNEYMGIDTKTDADFNGDGVVTLADFIIWRNGYMSP